jgi:hypothetical protein
MTNEKAIQGEVVEQTALQKAVAAEKIKEILYDADAPQRVRFQTERAARFYNVVHIFGPILDDNVLEYERSKNQRIGEADANQSDDEDATLIRSNTFNAALIYWNKSGTKTEGYAGKVSDRDKAFAVGLLFGVEFESLRTAESDQLCPEEGEDESTYIMRCLFDGDEVYTQAVMRSATANQIEQFESLMEQTLLVRGTRYGQRDQRIPARAKRLAEMFDQMVVSTKGYEGRLPLHHKVAFALRHLRAEQKAITGN